MISLDPLVLSIALGVVIPIVVALVTKLALDPRWKAIASLVLSAIVGTIVEINNRGGTFEWKAAVVATAITAVSSIASYLGLWKPVADVNATLAPNRGVGPSA